VATGQGTLVHNVNADGTPVTSRLCGRRRRPLVHADRTPGGRRVVGDSGRDPVTGPTPPPSSYLASAARTHAQGAGCGPRTSSHHRASECEAVREENKRPLLRAAFLSDISSDIGLAKSANGAKRTPTVAKTGRPESADSRTFGEFLLISCCLCQTRSHESHSLRSIVDELARSA
jgi:hypothetical protein